jgi:hypothetical protein
MNALIRPHLDAVARLCRHHDVRRLALFGSAAREDFDPLRSDVDFLMDFEPMAPGS